MNLQLMLQLAILALATSGYADDGQNNLVIETRTGQVEGQRQVAANGAQVDMFWGIPYAEPPLGDLRFRAPQPIKRLAIFVIRII